MVNAVACANIALIKYWGKRDAVLNLPGAGSFSLTLAALRTETRISPAAGDADELVLDGTPASGRALERVQTFLDWVRAPLQSSQRVRVDSRNSFPTAAGLASSASAFAALATAADAFFSAGLDARARSILARRGSGSAARSIFGGYARMHAGTNPDGSDAFAEPIRDLDTELVAAIAVAAAGPKKIGSTEGMERTAQTSPYHGPWLQTVQDDLARIDHALRSRQWDDVAEIVEGNCLAMHANAMAARPGILYFRPATLFAIEKVRALRAAGTPVFFTIDAGPHVVAFTLKSHQEAVASALSEHPDVRQVIRSDPGPDAYVEEPA